MLRKLLFICTALFILLPTSVFASEIKVMVNGEQVQFDQPPVIENDRVYVPIRTVAEKMGWEVDFMEQDNTVRAMKYSYDDLNNYLAHIYFINLGNNTTRNFIAVNQIQKNNDEKAISIKPIIKNNRTLVSVRELSEGLYANVEWNGITKTVIVKTKTLPYYNEIDVISNSNANTTTSQNTDQNETSVIEELTENEVPYEEKQTNYEQEVVRLVNEKRTLAGLKALEIHDGLMKSARLKSDEMAELNYFSHNSPIYGTTKNIIKTLGIDLLVGENLNTGRLSPEGVIDSWMSSKEGHKENMLNSKYNYIGVGYSYSKSDNVTYWTLHLGY